MSRMTLGSVSGCCVVNILSSLIVNLNLAPLTHVERIGPGSSLTMFNRILAILATCFNDTCAASEEMWWVELCWPVFKKWVVDFLAMAHTVFFNLFYFAIVMIGSITTLLIIWEIFIQDWVLTLSIFILQSGQGKTVASVNKENNTRAWSENDRSFISITTRWRADSGLEYTLSILEETFPDFQVWADPDATSLTARCLNRDNIAWATECLTFPEEEFSGDDI